MDWRDGPKAIHPLVLFPGKGESPARRAAAVIECGCGLFGRRLPFPSGWEWGDLRSFKGTHALKKAGRSDNSPDSVPIIAQPSLCLTLPGSLPHGQAGPAHYWPDSRR